MMKQTFALPYFFTVITLVLFSSCSGYGGGQEHLQSEDDETKSTSNSGQPQEGNKNYGRYDSMSCGLMDSKGVLWFGTNHEGVYRFDPSLESSGKKVAFTRFSQRDGLPHNDINTIMEDQSGNIWFGTAAGMCRFDGSIFTSIPLPWTDTTGVWLDDVYPVVNPNGVRSMAEDREGNIWIGSNGEGAYRYDGNSFTQFLSKEGRKQIDSLHHNVVSTVLIDNEGNKWFTSMTHGGISRYDGEIFSHFNLENGLSDDMLFSSLKDSDGNLWFGSLGNREGGLHKYDGKTFTNFNEDDGLCNTNIVCLFEDRTGKLWMGSHRGDLCTYDGQTFSPFETKDGQRFSRVLFILEDTHDNIWFGSIYGNLYRYNPSNEALTDFTQKQ